MAADLSSRWDPFGCALGRLFGSRAQKRRAYAQDGNCEWGIHDRR